MTEPARNRAQIVCMSLYIQIMAFNTNTFHCINIKIHEYKRINPSKQSTLADVSLTSVQRQFNVEVTLD